jgi:hypothetical protein
MDPVKIRPAPLRPSPQQSVCAESLTNVLDPCRHMRAPQDLIHALTAHLQRYVDAVDGEASGPQQGHPHLHDGAVAVPGGPRQLSGHEIAARIFSGRTCQRGAVGSLRPARGRLASPPEKATAISAAEMIFDRRGCGWGAVSCHEGASFTFLCRVMCAKRLIHCSLSGTRSKFNVPLQIEAQGFCVLGDSGPSSSC